MHAAFARPSAGLLDLVTEYMKLFPDEKAAIVDALNDTSHGVFVDPAAAAMWREHYLAALRLDVAKLNIKDLTAGRKRWREQVLADPSILRSRLGPEIVCEIPGVKVRIAAFEEDATVSFDVNTAQPGIMRLIPGISENEISAWQSARPFRSADDFRARGGSKASTLAALKF